MSSKSSLAPVTPVTKTSCKWAKGKFENFADVIMGQSPSGDSYNKKAEGVGLINGPTEFTEKYPIKVQWTTSPTKICKIEDVLLCVRGSSTGRMNIADEEYCIGRGVAAIRSKKSISQQFLQYQIYILTSQILKNISGSTFPNIDGCSLRSMNVLVPPLPEQHRIVAVLETWDAAIEKLKKKIELKKNIKKGLMQQLLTGKKRLPGFSGGSSNSRIPKGWKLKSIGEFADTSSGGTPRSSQESYYKNGTIPWLNSGEVRKGRISHFENYITKEGLENSSAKIFPVNTVLVAMYGATTGQVGILAREACTNQALCGILPNDRYCSDYLFHYLTTKTNELINLSSGAAQPNISQEIIRNYLILIPNLDEQIAIGCFFNELDYELLMLIKKLTKLEAQKTYLLNNLVSGKILTSENLSFIPKDSTSTSHDQSLTLKEMPC